MSEDTGDFRADVGAALAGVWSADASANPSDHPTIDELIAYREGQLAEPETDRMQEHLVSCRECLDRLAEVEDFVEAGVQGPPEVGSLEEASAWRALEERRTSSGGTAPGRTAPGRTAPGRTIPGHNAALAMAASFLVAAIGLGLWAVQQHGEAAQLRGQLAALSEPQPATRIVDLHSEARVRSGSATQQPPVDRTGVAQITAVLHEPELPDFAAYEGELVSPEGRELWRGRLGRDEHGDLVLGIPLLLLDPGSYRIDLYGIADDDRQQLATFPLDLVRSDEE